MPRSPSAIYLDQEDIDSSEQSANGGVLPRKRKVLPFGWYGGKYSHLDWLLPLLPEAHHYCEPFGGSGAALINRPPSPVETYNDLDGEVVNFFRVLREQRDELISSIQLTPFSREEFFIALTPGTESITAVERARRFFIKARQTRTGLAQSATLGRWANCKETSRVGMSGVVSRWLGSVESLPEIATRLLRVQIENRPASDLITLYDGEGTLFYCDPPYLHSARSDSKAYAFEMTDEEHEEIARQLHQVQGKVAMSGYQCEVMNDLYSDWALHLGPEKRSHSNKQLRQEALWTNYQVA